MTRVLCSGSAGFIGQELCRKLEERGFEVWRFDRMVHARYNPHRDRYLYGDVSNPESCKRAVRESEPDIIVHLAAIASTDKIMYDEPNRMTEVTLNGTINMGNAFGEYVKDYREDRAPISDGFQFCYASSSEIYGNATNPPFNEQTSVHPCNVYAVAKYAGELYLREYFGKAYDIPWTVMRNFNTYGNLGYQRTLIDRCVVEMLANKPVIKLGNPDAVRDWEYADDHVSSYLTVIGNPKAYGETFNFCRGEPYTIRDTVDRIQDATDYAGTVEWGTGFARKNDVQLLHGNPSKAKRVLGWTAKYNLHDGLQEYVTRLQASNQVRTKS